MPNPTASVNVLSSTTMRVNFSEPMLNTPEIFDPASYAFTPIDAAGVATVSVDAATANYADLTVTEMTQGGGYELAFDPEIVDQDEGLPVVVPAAFTGQGTKPQISAAVALNKTKVRVTFDEPMDLNGNELENPARYTITPTTPGALPVFVSEIDAIGAIPVSIELTTSEMKEGASYDVEIDSSGPIRDTAWNPIDPAGASASFAGIGEAPLLALVKAVSETRVDVIFDETMKDSPDIRDPSKYAWDLGLVTVAVLDFVGDTVKLVTSPQTEGVLYTLTIG